MIIRLPKECFGSGEDFPKVEILYKQIYTEYGWRWELFIQALEDSEK